ncbi:RNA polymerase sigma factor [Desulforamulus aquiferis]|uniref:Sigma-70 family RNA polymerase sigma factor n=1 Tax=Desulforamulus aquiferis TaxID=1397668 RepID=A0AAW7ZB41_9FIRM|nr:sigma-70 family RNA polymerase sigma factor [Desulforamulus aquiferis]MDO7786631.1 sigma-70 family RNA polymerase sigma factor [Desulforamulus aquiferis]RYD05846.1 hypothetical protein N752_08100 [Desulforamulus aquiferis]
MNIYLINQHNHIEKDIFHGIVLLYQNQVYSLALRYLKNPHDAEDLSQEVWIKIYNNLSLIKKEASIKYWVLNIAKNACLDELRKKQRKKIPLSIEYMAENNYFLDRCICRLPLPDEKAIIKESAKCILKKVETLSEQQRKVILLREYLGFTYLEISRLEGCSIGTVKSRLNSARNILRKKLAETC